MEEHRHKWWRIKKSILKSQKYNNSKISQGKIQKPYYCIDAYKPPLLIKPPVQQNLNKPPLFWTKSPLLEAFVGKNFNKPPPWNPHILINRRRFICVDKVCNLVKSQIRYFYKSPRLWRLGKVGKSDPTQHKV